MSLSNDPLCRNARIRGGKKSLRKEELLIEETDLNRIWILRKVLSQLSEVEAMELLVEKLSKTKTNEDFLAAMSKGL